MFTVASTHKVERTKCLHSIGCCKIPEHVCNYIQNNYVYNTRSEDSLYYHITLPRTDLDKISLNYQSVKLWNNLPFSIKSKRSLKFNLLENQGFEHHIFIAYIWLWKNHICMLSVIHIYPHCTADKLLRCWQVCIGIYRAVLFVCETVYNLVSK